MQGAALMQLDCEGSQQYCIEHTVRYFFSKLHLIIIVSKIIVL